ncbi:carbon starvation protein A [Myxococcota bacterium]|nr:carbon starvation protein A [Myxococcota bacterium]
MNGALLIGISIVVFIAGYKFWGGYVSRTLGVDPKRVTPAHTMEDGIDYVPTKPAVLLGHHFSSIAGAAPIIGPIVAASFGWVAVALWILIGGVFMGAVHDFASIIISIRHQGRSVGEVIEARIGRRSKLLFLIFVFAALLLIMAVFTNAIANLFHAFPEAGTASMLFIGIAVVFGLAVYRFKTNFVLTSVLGVAALMLCIWLGYLMPVRLSVNIWKLILLAYVVVASILPVWVLLQPRDYLNSFILYVMLLGLVAGIIFVNPTLKLHGTPTFSTSQGPLMPILFVTVACGALSGFHSLVASGTTSKQLDNEAHAKPVGYGGMLIESLLAMGALITAAMLTKEQLAGQNPVAVFSNNAALLVSKLGIPFKIGRNFMALAVAAFALTSLDTATRLGRFALQEFFMKKDREEQPFLAHNRYVATFITVALGSVLVFSGTAKEIWPIFGAANQLLAALAFMTISVWLVHLKKPIAFTMIPGVFIYFVTLFALGYNIWSYGKSANYPLAVLSSILIVLALFLGIEGVKNITAARSQKQELA